MMKDTALVSFLGVTAASAEIFRRGQLVGKADFKNLEAYVAVALVYWGLTVLFTFFQSRLEARVGRGYDRGRADLGAGRAGTGGGDDDRDVVVRIDGLHKTFGHLEVSAASTWRCARRGGRDLRALRVGQVHAAALRELHRGPDRRHRSRWPASGSRAGTAPGASASRSVSSGWTSGWSSSSSTCSRNMTVLDNVTVRAALRRPRDQPAIARAGPGPARPGRPGRQGEGAPDPALRRSAAAGRHRPGAGDGARGDALRRAHLGPRPGAHRRGARGDEVARHRDAHDR